MSSEEGVEKTENVYQEAARAAGLSRTLETRQDFRQNFIDAFSHMKKKLEKA